VRFLRLARWQYHRSEHRVLKMNAPFFRQHFKITGDRGRAFESEWSPWTIATFHPSALFRIPDDAHRAVATAQLIADLRQAAERLAFLEQQLAAWRFRRLRRSGSRLYVEVKD
jgi:hypothetical protein